jgi:hypothetical protein
MVARRKKMTIRKKATTHPGEDEAKTSPERRG